MDSLLKQLATEIRELKKDLLPVSNTLPIAILLTTLIAILLTPLTAIAYSQDPRTCNDPRTPHPTPNPPCIRKL
jgi:hypothetical protein